MQSRMRNYLTIFLLLSSFILGSTILAAGKFQSDPGFLGDGLGGSTVQNLDSGNKNNVTVSKNETTPKNFLEKIPDRCIVNGDCTFCDVLKVFATIMQWILSTVAALSLFFVIYGGFDLLTSGGNSEKVDAGKKKLGGAIIGLMVVLGSYLVINAVIFMFTDNKTKIPNFNPKTWSTFDCDK